MYGEECLGDGCTGGKAVLGVEEAEEEELELVLAAGSNMNIDLSALLKGSAHEISAVSPTSLSGISNKGIRAAKKTRSKIVTQSAILGSRAYGSVCRVFILKAPGSSPLRS